MNNWNNTFISHLNCHYREYLFFSKSVTVHIACFSQAQSSMSKIIFISAQSISETYCLQLFASARNEGCSCSPVCCWSAYVRWQPIPSCKVMDPKRNLTWEQCTPCNSSQDSILCLFLQTCKVLEESLFPPALRCHLNCLRVHKCIGKVGKVIIREDMFPF